MADKKSKEETELISTYSRLLDRCTVGPDKERDTHIFWLHHRAGLSARAIADLPGIQLTTKGVESRILRITRELRIRIAQELPANGSSTAQRESLLDIETQSILTSFLPPIRPPKDLDFILYLLMSPADCKALIGDLEELYRNLVERLGKRRADLWYTKQVLTSIWPLLISSVRHLGSSTVVNALCLVLRFWGQGALADQLKQMSEAKRKRK